MLCFKYEDSWCELDYEGIKIIETPYTTNWIKKVFLDENSKVTIDGRHINFKNNVLYINEFSKISDFLQLNKNNFIYKLILDKIGENSLVNQDLVNEIINEINTELNNNNLLDIQYDLSKIISGIFDINNDDYIDDKFIDILNLLGFDEKKLIIFDNCKFINYKKCQQLLNNYNILIVCNDIRWVINYYKELEICCFMNKKVFEIIHLEKLISYLEMKLSEPISEETLNDYLSFGDTKLNSLINFHLKSL